MRVSAQKIKAAEDAAGNHNDDGDKHYRVKHRPLPTSKKHLRSLITRDAQVRFGSTRKRHKPNVLTSPPAGMLARGFTDGYLIRTKIGPGAALTPNDPRGATMPDYRIYAVGSDGRLIAVEDLDCADDQEAIKKATQAAKGSGIELREGERCVVRLLPAPSLKWNLPTLGSDDP
jgi:hypothetical protein